MLFRTSRRFRRWAGVVLIAAPTVYLLSFGPACWWFADSAQGVPGGPNIGSDAACVSKAYWPIGWGADRFQSLRPIIAWYSRLCGTRTAVIVPVTGGRGSQGTLIWSKASGSVPYE